MKQKVVSIVVATLVFVSLFAVVSIATSVSSQASPPGQPIAAGTGPALCLYNDNTANYYYYLFAKGYDGALWYRVMLKDAPANAPDWGWLGGWASLGGQLSSSPCAVSRSPGYLDVYVAGTDGAVYDRPYYDGAWHNWLKVGGQVAKGTGPGASAWPSREDVFVAGTNGALYQKTWNAASGWTNWVKLGGYLTSSPGASSWDVGRIDVAVRGGDGAAWHKYYWNGWSSWGSLGGQLASSTGPAVTSSESGSLSIVNILVAGTDGAMWQKTWTSTSQWSGWKYVGGCLTSSPTAYSNNSPYIIVFIRGCGGSWSGYENPAGNVFMIEYFTGKWQPWSGGMYGPPCQANCD